MREQSLLNHIYAHAGGATDDVPIPPGDDMGALRIGGQTVLISVDQLADAIHVSLDTTPLEKVARKAITRNLSDVAAMAAQPRGAVCAAALPRGFGEQRANELFEHMRRVAETYQCPLIGGDITVWDRPLLLSVTVLAEPAGVEPVLRSTARTGDAIYVTGTLGGSLESIDGYTHHLDFEPRIALARQLASDARTRPSAMIDLSDGLGRDLARVCRASHVSATIDADALPISAAAHQASHRSGAPPWRHAVGDGEDHELLLTAPPHVMPTSLDGVPITRIGVIEAATTGCAARLRQANGVSIDLDELGWEHHA